MFESLHLFSNILSVLLTTVDDVSQHGSLVLTSHSAVHLADNCEDRFCPSAV